MQFLQSSLPKSLKA